MVFNRTPSLPQQDLKAVWIIQPTMATNPRTLTTVIVVLIAALLVSSLFAGYFFLRYQQAENSSNLYLSELKATNSAVISTNILVDFGNGSRTWYNNTAVQPGWNVYLATVVITHGNMNATWYPAYGEHLVTALDGVQNTQSESWFLWTYNSTSSWQVAQVGADQLPASAGSIYAWSYCGDTSSYTPTCAKP